MRHFIGIALLTGVFSASLSSAVAAGKIRFNRDVRPILSDKCFFCHGPDSKKREADMRLDQREGALEAKAITPGDAMGSEMIKRILTTDADDHMPPAKSKLADLTPAEIAVLKQWINEGAEYEAHWSFIPLKLEQATKGMSIDGIVQRELADRGMEMQPVATPNVLVRRLSFDLTGLPPSPEAVTKFEKSYAANADAAVKGLVEELLATPQYGERMATDWLDMARYADSYGFQVDRDREVWMWRDWVIKAFNENLPFNEFITWQLAGDLLPNPSDDQRLATAFNRLHQQESEGGSVEEEYRVEYVCDRVQTVASAFLGLTYECARCHDHKFDPVSQRDYYGLFSMLQNIDEAGLYSFFTPSPPTPTMMLMDDAAKAKMKDLRGRVKALEATLPKAILESPQMEHGEIAHFTFDGLDGNKLADALHPLPAKRDPKDKSPDPSAILKGENKLVPGKMGNAVQFTGDDAVDTPVGNFHRHEPFSVSLWLKTPDLKDRAVVFHRSRAWTDAASRGYELLIEDGRLKWSLIHFWPGNAISIRAKDALPLNEWVQVVVTNDGSSRADGLRLYVNGKRAAVEVVRDALTKDITGGGGDNIALGERFRDRGFKGGVIDDFRVFDRDVSQAFDEKQEGQRATVKAARAELTALADAQKEIMVMSELRVPKKAYVLTRGQYDQRAEEVEPVTPVALSPFPKDQPKNRLGLARWLTAPEHPLTARVTVNRFWQGLFGRGLVKTAADFGSQGERPLYPELLDYLASRFILSGWDVKALLREIVSSRVYQQRSTGPEQMMQDDPENQWLARGPRFRLPAEMIRDNALAACGLLKLKVGGPPVNPYEMEEAFKPVTAGDSMRRSLYTTWRRTSPPPAMLAFDAPRRAVCSAKRDTTDSPLQALVLLNGVQFVEAARVMGEALYHDANGNVDKMIEQGFLRCLSRRPDEEELKICRQLHAEQLAYFTKAPQEAAALLKPGSAPRDKTISDPNAAAAAVLAQALLNHDECVVRR